MELTAEQSYSREFTFPDVIGVQKALVTYEEKVTLDDDATLNSLVVQGVPVSLADFRLDASGNYTAAVVAEDIGSTVVNAQPKSTKSTVSIDANTPDVPVLLANGAAEPSSTKTVITVTNPNNAALTDGFPATEQVKVTGTLGGNAPQALSVTAVPEQPGVYQVTFHIANDPANKDKKLRFSVTLTQSDNYLAKNEPVAAEAGVTDKAVHVQALTGPGSVMYGDTAVFTTRRWRHGRAGLGAERTPGGKIIR